jgi:hypothetical protein
LINNGYTSPPRITGGSQTKIDTGTAVKSTTGPLGARSQHSTPGTSVYNSTCLPKSYIASPKNIEAENKLSILNRMNYKIATASTLLSLQNEKNLAIANQKNPLYLNQIQHNPPQIAASTGIAAPVRSGPQSQGRDPWTQG